MTILVDLDDTIEQLLDALISRANEKYHENILLDEVNDWELTLPGHDVSKEDILNCANEPDFWNMVQPIPGAAEALKHFMDEGHSVYIVTATRIEHIEKKMNDFLFRYFPFLSWDQVIITHRKQMIHGDVLIDDGVHNLEGGQYRKILFTAPYNRHFDAEAHGMMRVHNWEEIVEIIDHMNQA